MEYFFIYFINSTEPYIFYDEDPERKSSTITTTTTTTTTTRSPRTTKSNISRLSLNGIHQHQHTTTTTTKPTTEYPASSIYDDKTPFDLYHFFDLSSTTTTTTTVRPSTKISPYYYGLLTHSDKTTKSPFVFNSFLTSSTTKSPFNFGNYFSTSKRSSSPTTTTTRKPTYTTRTTSTRSPYFSSTSSSSSSSHASSPTRNPVFDVYLKRLASTTKSPYNFENFAQYFKTSTANPKFSYNLFGANSNNSPSNTTATG